MVNDFTISEAISAGWNLTKSHWKGVLKITFVGSLIALAPQALLALILLYADELAIPLQFLIGFFQQYISYGIIKALIKSVDGDEATVGDIFSLSFKQAVFLIISTLIIGFATMIGGLLFIIPGIYIAIALMFAPMVIIDNRNIGIVDAFKLSWDATKGIKLKIIGLGIVLGLINLLGVIALFVGLLVTATVTIMVELWLFRHLFPKAGDTQPTANPQPQVTPPPSMDTQPTANPQPQVTPPPSMDTQPTANPQPQVTPPPSMDTQPTANPQPQVTPPPSMDTQPQPSISSSPEVIQNPKI